MGKLVDTKFVKEIRLTWWLTCFLWSLMTSGRCALISGTWTKLPKDCYPLSRIDQLVDATSIHELLIFMDYLSCDQIKMSKKDAPHTTFQKAPIKVWLIKYFHKWLGTQWSLPWWYPSKVNKGVCHQEDLEKGFARMKLHIVRLNP